MVEIIQSVTPKQGYEHISRGEPIFLADLVGLIVASIMERRHFITLKSFVKMNNDKALRMVMAGPERREGMAKLNKILEEIDYLNEKVIPQMRNALGDMTITKSMIFAFAPEYGDGRKITEREFISFSGKKAYLLERAFLDWYEASGENRANAARGMQLRAKDNGLVMIYR